MIIYTYQINENLSNVLGIEPNYIVSLSDQKLKQSVEEVKQQTGPIKTAWEGCNHSEESKRKISAAHLGRDAYWARKKRPEHSAFMTQRNLEYNHMKGIAKEDHPMFGRKRPDSSEHYKQLNKRVGVCPHCNKKGQLNAMKRWHFDNCRHKQ